VRSDFGTSVSRGRSDSGFLFLDSLSGCSSTRSVSFFRFSKVLPTIVFAWENATQPRRVPRNFYAEVQFLLKRLMTSGEQ